MPISEQPPAIQEALDWAGDCIHISGGTASLRFTDGAVWKFGRLDGKWVITDMPILPPPYYPDIHRLPQSKASTCIS